MATDEKNLGAATLVGGLVTVAVALAVGVPLLSSPAATDNGDRQRAEVLARALSGEIRF
jgi:hypothetical protein